ncbi:DUF4827 family protein [Parabacteroides sp. PF5-9]|uniref:DUF4827 family protein n=1 Tax=Parabacteroides sp. PF5-9 TaxID=1742404 RepID=UPI002472F536|nr:DUF4827 family protein [Parabacteroides sp. PF5-9]MDH6357704.1 hypothetical protein [Parabacteroides sp. PF5-9]
MKRAFNVLLIVCVTLVAIACGSKTRTYTDMKKDQRKAISRLMDEKGYEVIKDYPENGVFGKNEFVQLSNGVYLNVIDSGNGTRAELGKTVVYCRFTAYRPSLDSTSMYYTYTNYGPTSGGTIPLEIKYGYTSSPENVSSTSILASYASEGLHSILQYVGDKSTVRAIVPFEIGSQNVDMKYGYPLYYEILKFTFE